MHSVWDLGSPAQGSHRHPLHWKVKSQPLDHPGSPWLVWATQGRSLPLCPSVVLGWIVGHTVIYYEVCWPFPRKFFFSDERKAMLEEVPSLPLSLPLGLCYEDAMPGYMTAVSILRGSKFCMWASVLRRGSESGALMTSLGCWPNSACPAVLLTK